MSSARSVALRASAPLLLPAAALGVTFGLLASPVIGALATLVMSAIVWSGAAQFGAVSVLAAGGGPADRSLDAACGTPTGHLMLLVEC